MRVKTCANERYACILALCPYFGGVFLPVGGCGGIPYFAPFLAIRFFSDFFFFIFYFFCCRVLLFCVEMCIFAVDIRNHICIVVSILRLLVKVGGFSCVHVYSF